MKAIAVFLVAVYYTTLTLFGQGVPSTSSVDRPKTKQSEYNHYPSTASIVHKKKIETWENMNLKGKVKMIRSQESRFEENNLTGEEPIITEYFFNDKGALLELNCSHGRGIGSFAIYDIPGGHQCYYDNKGKLISIEFYHINLSDETVKIQEKTISTFDIKGNKTTDNTYNQHDKLIRTTSYTYDNKNNLIEELSLRSSSLSFSMNPKKPEFEGKYTYKYDINNRIIEVERISIISIIQGKTKYKYNTDGLLQEESSYYRTEETPYSITIYSYNNKGYEIERKEKNVKTGRLTVIETKYDNQNNPIEKTTLNSDSSNQVKITYKYAYDKKGNWDIQQEYDEKGTAGYIRNREIEYYD